MQHRYVVHEYPNFDVLFKYVVPYWPVRIFVLLSCFRIRKFHKVAFLGREVINICNFSDRFKSGVLRYDRIQSTLRFRDGGLCCGMCRKGLCLSRRMCYMRNFFLSKSNSFGQ
jgi:hypothetical protein